MADISILSRVLSGAVRNVDLSVNALVVGSLKISASELTSTILANLINLQNGSDFANGTNAHTHDGRYFTETELSSATGTTGSDLIGDDDDYSNFTPTAATVKGALAGIDAALASAGGVEFNDSTFRIYDNGDNTKRIAFEASGIATATTRTITMPDANVNLGLVATAIQRDGSVAFTANQPMGGFKLTGLAAGTTAGDSVRYEQAILTSGANAFAANQSMGGFNLTNVADPSAAQDAATKAYVDSLLDGRTWKQAVRAASTANVAIATGLEDGDTLDGVTLATGDRVLLKNQTASEENGIYVVVASGAASRSSDANTALELEGAAVFVMEGTANADTQWAQTSDNFTLDTDPVVWVLTSANHFSGHDMITLSGGQISVDLATVSGLESSNPGNAAGQLRVKLEASNPTLQINGSNELGVKLDAARAITTGASGIGVNVDNSTIEINTNALRVKAAGITESHLAASVAGAGLTGGAGSPLAVGAGDGIDVAADAISVDVSDLAGAGLENDGSNNLRIATAAYDQSTITGGGGSAAAVQRAPLVKRSLVAGESFAANTSFVVRWALTGETAGRVYKADKDASSTNKYMGIGIAHSTGAVSAGGNIDVTLLGEHTLGSSDSAFNAADVGKELFVGTTGAFILGSALANTTNEAAFCVGVIQATDKIWVDFKNLRGIA